MSKKEQVVKNFEELLLEIKQESSEEKFREEYKNLMVEFRESFFNVLDGTVTPKVIKKESTSSNPNIENQVDNEDIGIIVSEKPIPKKRRGRRKKDDESNVELDISDF